MKKRILKEKENDKKTININIAMSILLVVALSFISVGYAIYGQILNNRGTVTLKPQGKIAITNVELISSKNVRDDSIPAFTDDSVDFNLTFEKADDSTEEAYQAIYSITIDNGTFYDYDFNLANFKPVITNSSGIEVDPNYLNYKLEGINLGDSIPALNSVTFTLTLDFTPEEDDTYSVDGEINTQLEEQPHGSLLGSIPDDAQGDLRESLGNDITSVTVTVINTYQSPREFTLNIADTSHFKLTNSDGSDLSSFTIEGGTTETYTIYIKRVDGAIFTNDSITTNISLSYSDVSNINCGSVTLLVDKLEIKDETPPEISDVSVTINDATSDDTTNKNVGSVDVSWTGLDAEAGVKKYYVIVYTVSNNVETYYNTFETTDTNPKLTITGLADGSYSFKVYGENNDNYKPSDEQISNCNDKYCSKSSVSTFDWHYTVSLTSNSTNIKSISPTAVNRGKKLTATITPESYSSQCGSGYYTLSSTITVTMDGTNITTGNTAGHYSYTRNSSAGTLIVYGVTGDITVYTTANNENN